MTIFFLTKLLKIILLNSFKVKIYLDLIDYQIFTSQLVKTISF